MTTKPVSRLDRRKAATRAALIGAAQELMAAGRMNVPIQEITEAADLGTGSFYNHFETKDELFLAAVTDALEKQADMLDHLTDGIDDPAEIFALRFRITGRIHRRGPQLSKVILATGLSMMRSTEGLVPRARRDIAAAAESGRFTVRDLDSTMVLVVGAALCLGQLLHDQPELDDAETTDRITEDLLRMLGLTARQAATVCAQPIPDLDALMSDGSAA